jgi:hypothetical protein
VIKPLVQPQQEQDGYRPPFVMIDEPYMIDELSAYLIDKYMPNGVIRKKGRERSDTNDQTREA